MANAEATAEGDAMKPPTAVPIAALTRVLAMAEEMSLCSSYALQGDDGESLGTDPKVTRDLERVREFLRTLRRR